MQPTSEQEDAIAKFQTGKKLRINAYAGTGKTSSLILLARSSPGSIDDPALDRSDKEHDAVAPKKRSKRIKPNEMQVIVGLLRAEADALRGSDDMSRREVVCGLLAKLEGQENGVSP